MKKIMKKWSLTNAVMKQWVMVIASVSFLLFVVFFNMTQISAESNRPMPVKAQQAQLPEVAVTTVLPAQYKARVISYGEATPHFALSLTAQVNGQIQTLDKQFESGQRVMKGETLIQLEDSEYLAKVATAENSLATAQLALLEEQRTVAQARAEWRASGLEGEPESELVLHEPQLKAAKAAVKQAEMALRNARRDLERTKIIAPFDALIIERSVSPGTYVQPGAAVASLYSTEYVEIRLALSAKDWQSLPNIDLSKDLAVRLTSVDGEASWLGRVLRVEQHLDGTTRQRALVLAVDRPLDQTPALYPGTFLNAQLEGRIVDNLWKLPSAALSQRGEVWFVTKENTLASFTAEPIFSDSAAIYIAVPETLRSQPQHVLIHPLNNYVKGMKVKMIGEDNENG